jgi:hypothetical protein
MQYEVYAGQGGTGRDGGEVPQGEGADQGWSFSSQSQATTEVGITLIWDLDLWFFLVVVEGNKKRDRSVDEEEDDVGRISRVGLASPICKPCSTRSEERPVSSTCADSGSRCLYMIFSL